MKGNTLDGLADSFSRAQLAQIRCKLAECGLRSGTAAIVFAASPTVAAIAAQAVFELGAPLVVLDWRMPGKALASIASEVSANVIVVDSRMRTTLDGIALGMPILEVCEQTLSVTVSLQLSEPKRATLLPDKTALIVYTSGSSGQRRGVLLSRKNVEFVLGAIQARLQYRTEDVIGVFVPLAFDYGLYQVFLARQVNAMLTFGSNLVTGPDLVERLETSKITILPAVPTLVLMLLQILRRRPRALPHLRMITSTGEHLPQEWVRELGMRLPHVRVYPMYGLTECKRVSILMPEEFAKHPASVGRALDGTEVFAVDSQGRRVEPGRHGELVVVGPHVGHGYHNAPVETALRFRVWGPNSERALFTGDFGHVDREGFIHVQGRNDGLFKHRGARMSAAEVERTALQLPGVDVAVLVHDRARDSLKLFVQGQQVSTESLRQHLRSHLEPFKLPGEIEWLDSVPRTGNGKIDRGKLSQAVAMALSETRDVGHHTALSGGTRNAQSTSRASMRNRWVRLSTFDRTAVVRLFCFSHAGGSASAFNAWHCALAPEVSVCPIQLPGRETRLSERAMTWMHEMADRVADSILGVADKPFAICGHSMGAVLGFEVSRRLSEAGLSGLGPKLFVASGSPPPHLAGKDESAHLSKDADLVSMLHRLGGTSDMILNDPQLRQIFIPTLRSDLTALATYELATDFKLRCPTLVLAGSKDERAPASVLVEWRNYTTGPFRQVEFDGGHFFIKSKECLVLEAIRSALRPVVLESTGTDCATTPANEGTSRL